MFGQRGPEILNALSSVTQGEQPNPDLARVRRVCACLRSVGVCLCFGGGLGGTLGGEEKEETGDILLLCRERPRNNKGWRAKEALWLQARRPDNAALVLDPPNTSMTEFLSASASSDTILETNGERNRGFVAREKFTLRLLWWLLTVQVGKNQKKTTALRNGLCWSFHSFSTLNTGAALLLRLHRFRSRAFSAAATMFT